MRRITIKNLDSLADHINEVTGSPKSSWTRDEAGKLRSNVGNHHISQAYGGYCLHRMENEAGGVSCPVTDGHIPARDLYERMQAYIRGYREAINK